MAGAGDMTIAAFAERVLMGMTLDDKLATPPATLDDPPDTIALRALPEVPGRPAELGFRAGAASAQAHVFRARDESDPGRGRLLHAFANHELLALELMALMLLRFPDAPAKMRQDLVRMIGEEQTHLGLYLARMGQLGVAFGEVELNDYFWRKMRALELPAFVAAMNLTFEQANLDHALTYRDYFRTIGDADSAAVMERVLADEIGHVKGGLAWLRGMKQTDEDDWSAYLRMLPEDLSPMRARGADFNREARRAAGLTEDFIERLAVCAAPRGHAARVFLFDPFCDESAGHGRPGLQPPAGVVRLQRDLECLPLVFAAPDDVVLVSAEPSLDFLRELVGAGFELPRFLTGEAAARGTEKLAGLYPWGWSPDTRTALAPCFGRVVKERGPLLERLASSEAEFLDGLREVYGRAFDLNVLRSVLDDAAFQERFGDKLEAAVLGQQVITIEETARIIAAGQGAFVLKSPFSASGRHRLRLEAVPTPDQARWIQKQFDAHGYLVLEPWLDRVLDLSFQGEILPDGAYVAHGSTRFLTDAAGRYRATFVGAPYNDLPGELRRFLNGGGAKERSVFRLLEMTAELVARELTGRGYRGPFAVDALVYRADVDGRLRCKPVVEVNPRFTMGRVARELSKRVRYGSRAIFVVLGRAQMEAAGHENFAELAADLRARYPVRLERSGTARLIAAGFVPLAGPERVTDFLPLLWCGDKNAEWPEVFAVPSGADDAPGTDVSTSPGYPDE